LQADSSRTEYAARMHRVLEYIDRRLDQNLQLTELADVAHFSRFHFHRLFAAWMGETLGDYLRRRRIEVAAMRLVAQPRLTVLQVALSVGFGSGEAFARAFKERFGRSATQWRRLQKCSGRANSNLDQPTRNGDQAAPVGSGQYASAGVRPMECAMNVKLIDRRLTQIAYLRHEGPYGASIAAFWQHQVYPWMVTNGLLGCPRYGISHDDPNITAPDRCRYDAAVEVAHSVELAGPVLRTTLPGGEYACAYFKGTAASIVDNWQSLLRDWLPSSGMQLDNRPSFEYYPQGTTFDPATGVFDCELCVPVTPL
jgi:AraC family transcriptional regulator